MNLLLFKTILSGALSLTRPAQTIKAQLKVSGRLIESKLVERKKTDSADFVIRPLMLNHGMNWIHVLSWATFAF